MNLLDHEGYHLSDGGVIQWPDDDDVIRRCDAAGNVVETQHPRCPCCHNWVKWAKFFEDAYDWREVAGLEVY